MSRDQEHDEAPLTDCEQLVEYFESGAKAPSVRGLGTEHEKFLYVGADRHRIPFNGPGGIESLFHTLADRFDYEPQLDQGRLVALVRGGEAISLEPGGQLEQRRGVPHAVREPVDPERVDARVPEGDLHEGARRGVAATRSLEVLPQEDPEADAGVVHVSRRTRCRAGWTGSAHRSWG